MQPLLCVSDILPLQWHSCCSLAVIRWRGGALRQSSSPVSFRCSHGMTTQEHMHLGRQEHWFIWFMLSPVTVLSWLSFSFKPPSSSFFIFSTSQCLEPCKIESSWPCKTFSWPCKTQHCDGSPLWLDLLYLASSSSFFSPSSVYPSWAVFPSLVVARFQYHIVYLIFRRSEWCGASHTVMCTAVWSVNSSIKTIPSVVYFALIVECSRWDTKACSCWAMMLRHVK